ncbi:hypothetical protein ACP70R_001789 [Stipagrostis hirtigluma subsp. patula]
MSDDIADKTPQDFNECVSLEQLQTVVHNVRKGMIEIVTKAVTDAIIKLDIGNIIESLDKRLAKLTDKVAALETRPAHDEDVTSGNTSGDLPEYIVFDVDSNVDDIATMRNGLRHRLHTNTTGMGGVPQPHHRVGTRYGASLKSPRSLGGPKVQVRKTNHCGHGWGQAGITVQVQRGVLLFPAL